MQPRVTATATIYPIIPFILADFVGLIFSSFLRLVKNYLKKKLNLFTFRRSKKAQLPAIFLLGLTPLSVDRLVQL